MKNKLIIITVFFLAFGVFGQKHVSGIISKDTRWNADDGPFIIDNDIVITRGIRLTIAPGTRIIINMPQKPDSVVKQIDGIDSGCVSIRVEGILECLGKPEKRIIFTPAKSRTDQYSWYGIVFNRSSDQYTEMSFTDISGAYAGISVKNCSPVIRNTLLEYNHIGINCGINGSAKIINCVIARNFATGIKASESNPCFLNNLIVFNYNLGIWCDGISKIRLEYNCFFGNGDGNFLDCDPEFGLLSKVNKNKDSTDFASNLFRDPVLAGSISDSVAAEHDFKLPTDRSKIRDTLIAKVIYDNLKDSTAAQTRHFSKNKYALSQYSPCRNAGNPSDQYKDSDGSRNDIGIYGGPEFLTAKKH
jgi:hypothetical protein